MHHERTAIKEDIWSWFCQDKGQGLAAATVQNHFVLHCCGLLTQYFPFLRSMCLCWSSWFSSSCATTTSSPAYTHPGKTFRPPFHHDVWITLVLSHKVQSVLLLPLYHTHTYSLYAILLQFSLSTLSLKLDLCQLDLQIFWFYKATLSSLTENILGRIQSKISTHCTFLPLSFNFATL